MLKRDVLARARKRAGVDVIPGEEDRAGLLALTKCIYPDSDIAKPEYVNWQYDLNSAGHALARLARFKSDIVGQYTVIPMEFKAGNSRLDGSLSLNTMTHPAHRAKGIFMVLAEEVYLACQRGGIRFTLGFPNPNSYGGFVRHLEFQDIGEIPLWVLPLNMKRLGAARLPPWCGFVAGAFQPGWDVLRRIRLFFGGDASLPVEELTAFDSSFDRLTEDFSEDYPYLVARHARYLTWRYQNHPTRRYRIWVVRSHAELSGYLVTRVMDVDGLSCGMLVDLVVRKGKPGEAVARALISRAIRELGREGADLLGCLMMRNTPGVQALRANGFLPCPRRFLPQPFSVIFRWHGDEPMPPGIQSLKNWYLTMGDYDAV